MAGRTLTVGAWAVVLTTILAACAVAGAPASVSDGQEKVQLLDVPYVPQSGALCGGAALAMVLRYWGESGVLAEDFAELLEPDQRGIRTGTLTNAVTARGWLSLVLPGTATGIRDELARNRPVIVLLRAGDDAFHYVVVVAWANGWVLVHDPNVGPLRSISTADFLTAWADAGSWALLILPPATTGSRNAVDPEPTALELLTVLAPCDTLVQRGIHLAATGDLAGAERQFLAAEALCPASASPLRERAGLRFNAGDWDGAIRLSAQALDRDPDDTHARRLLAASRFLTGDTDGALDTWNQLREPLVDLIHTDGLVRTRYAILARQLNLPPGRLLTAEGFRRARRRLAEMPAVTAFRLDLKPLPGGFAQVDVTVLERPLVATGPWDLGRAGSRALFEREVTVDVASPTGTGELWTANWRWWPNRPRVSLAMAVPTMGSSPGLWRVESFWERQTYAAAAADGELVREERRRSALQFADWIGPDLRLEVGVALDRWSDRGNHVALAGGAETRWASDRLGVTLAAAQWISLGNGAPFSTFDAGLNWRSSGTGTDTRWLSWVGLSRASPDAPLALWSGAGTGYGRDPLLRAHPLLNAGIIRGRIFGRTLVHGSLESVVRRWQLGPLQLGWAVFVDAAKAWDTDRADQIPWQVDGGTGLRLRFLGLQGQFRLDLAHGFSDGDEAASVGWRIP